LDGNPCGTYGIELDQNGTEPIEVCHDDILFTGTLNSDESVEVRVWYVSGETEASPRCYLWCTADGKWPEEPEDSFDENLVNGLVRNLSLTFFAKSTASVLLAAILKTSADVKMAVARLSSKTVLHFRSTARTM
jgi:hypothetical protein